MSKYVKIIEIKYLRGAILMKNLFLDLDDTYLDTDRYIRKVLKANGVSKRLWGIHDDIYVLQDIPECKDIIKACMSNYLVIPTKEGAVQSLKLLRTEYNVKFVTSCYSDYEEKAKRELFKKMDVDFIICRGGKSHVDMSGATFVDDHFKHLNESNASEKIFFFNPYELDPTISTGGFNLDTTLVLNWFELTDLLMSGGEDYELREYIHQRVQECCKAIRV